VPMRLPTQAAVIAAGRLGPQHRHGLSRRQFIAAAAGTAAGVQLVRAGAAQAAGVAAARTPGTPRPIPGGIEAGGTRFHVFLPGTGEPNTITDFNGFVGIGQVDGHGTGADAGRAFEVDNRFIVGEYVATDGKRYNAAFGFL